MRCRQVQHWMDRQLDEGPVVQPPPAVESHLSACPACCRDWRDLCAAETALRAPRPVAAPEGLLAEFHTRLAGPPQARRIPTGTPGWFWPAGSVLAGGLAVLAVAVLGLRSEFAPRRDRVDGDLREIAAVPSTGSQAPPTSVQAPPPPGFRGSASTAPSQSPPGYSSTGAGEARPPDAYRAPQTGPTGLGFQPVAPGRVESFAAAGGAAARDEVADAATAGRAKTSAADSATGNPSGLTLGGALRLGRTPAPGGGPNPAGGFGGQGVSGPALQRLETRASGSRLEREGAGQVPEELLVALRNEVSLDARTVPLNAAIHAIEEAAGIRLVLANGGPKPEVRLESEKLAVWAIVEDVARQAELRVYPVQGRLLLTDAQAPLLFSPQLELQERQQLEQIGKKVTPAEAPARPEAAVPAAPEQRRAAPPAPSPQGQARESIADQSRGAAAAPPERSRLAEVQSQKQPARAQPTRAVRLQRPLQTGARFAAPGRKPDPRYWPRAAWGTLPESGFIAQPASPPKED